MAQVAALGPALQEAGKTQRFLLEKGSEAVAKAYEDPERAKEFGREIVAPGIEKGAEYAAALPTGIARTATTAAKTGIEGISEVGQALEETSKPKTTFEWIQQNAGLVIGVVIALAIIIIFVVLFVRAKDKFIGEQQGGCFYHYDVGSYAPNCHEPGFKGTYSYCPIRRSSCPWGCPPECSLGLPKGCPCKCHRLPWYPSAGRKILYAPGTA